MMQIFLMIMALILLIMMVAYDIDTNVDDDDFLMLKIVACVDTIDADIVDDKYADIVVDDVSYNVENCCVR